MMKLLRKWLILSHRYAGIVLSLFVVLWFATGITMMYVGGMPRLTPEMRLEKLPNLDLARVRLTPAEAAETGLVESPGRTVLLSVMGRPAYRFGAGETTTVFADTGDVMEGATLATGADDRQPLCGCHRGPVNHARDAEPGRSVDAGTKPSTAAPQVPRQRRARHRTLRLATHRRGDDGHHAARTRAGVGQHHSAFPLLRRAA